MPWILLACAIAAEVFATSMLKTTQGFTRLWPSVAVILGYAAAFYLLSLVVRTLPVGPVYATWSALGTIAVTVIGVFFFSQHLRPWQTAGLVLTVVGVVLLNLGATTHDHDTAASNRSDPSEVSAHSANLHDR
ncbi:multidrug efflux SMR transporter [Pseudoclavibacter sp. CFCC 13611]|nr:multidrug efflux SMR transporter [Pseudoclavibacter sp. CFCC 13611]KAB1663889.1 multidrug efflux SMR transporter [Pseudoclavibacter sp. CFCC 13611]